MYRRRWAILGVLCLSLLIVVIANTSLNVALPTMSGDLGLSTSAQQWVVDAYSLVFAGLLFTAGSLGDRWGRKRFLQAGIADVRPRPALYATFFVDSARALIATRALMGIGGALVMPATLSILVNAFPSGERARAIAIWSGVAGGGGALGIVLGGWLVENFWWGSSFAMNIPVTVARPARSGCASCPSRDGRSRRPHRPARRGAVDLRPRRCWSTASSRARTGAGPTRRRLPRSSAASSCSACSGCGSCTPTSPMLEVRLFRNPTFTASSVGIMLVFLTMFGFFFVVSQLFQLVLGYGPFEAGLRMLPIMPMLMVFTPLSARAGRPARRAPGRDPGHARHGRSASSCSAC